jgi:lysozyme
MDIPARAVQLCKQFEGFSPVAYVCPAGYRTIGYGHLCAADHPPITEAQGEAYLEEDMQSALSGALRCCPVLAEEPEHRLAAIVDFTFNLGVGRLQASTLRRKLNERDWQAAGGELLRWVHGGGRVLPGLVARRRAEREILLGGGL